MLRSRWWVSLVLLGLLVLKAWVVAGMVQADARSLAADAAGIPIERVEMVDGLDVRLTGFTDEGSRDRAVAAVDALDSSWNVVGVVDGDGGDDADGDAAGSEPLAGAGEGASADEQEAPAATGPAVATPPASVSLTLDPSGEVALRGTVPDDAVRSALVDEAAASFGPGTVTVDLDVDGDTSGGEGVLRVIGTAGSDDQKAEWLASASSLAAVAGFEVADELDVAPVAEQLNALFELDPIEFDSTRATIRPASEATLDEAAEVINENPQAGRLRVVGHTDSDGGAAKNLDLSRRRAEAVVDHLVEIGGVDPDRLEAEGRGEAELKIDPEISAEDKQRNRRIEWEVVS